MIEGQKRLIKRNKNQSLDLKIQFYVTKTLFQYFLSNHLMMRVVSLHKRIKEKKLRV